MADLISLSKSIGLFIVPVGELESWLNLGVNKKRWITSALQEVDRGVSPMKLKNFMNNILEDIEEDSNKLV